MDPFTAFAIAQGAIKGIKSAIALGKDVQSIMGDIGKFYHAADMVQHGANKARVKGIRKSDADINREAFDLAWKAKQLWEQEKELKSYMFITGNRDVWEQMMNERTRMAKERADTERSELDKAQKDREAMGDMIMNVLLFIAFLAFMVPAIALGWQLLIVR